MFLLVQKYVAKKVIILPSFAFPFYSLLCMEVQMSSHTKLTEEEVLDHLDTKEEWLFLTDEGHNRDPNLKVEDAQTKKEEADTHQLCSSHVQ